MPVLAGSSDARGQGFWEVKSVKEKDAVGVAIRFWDALCFERIAGNSESVGVAIRFFFAFAEFHFGRDCHCPGMIERDSMIKQFSRGYSGKT
jgi:hypothetical protein